MIVDILCAVLDGERFLPDFLRGLDEQAHANWRLWVRDDGSTDRTVELLQARARNDSRVTLLHIGGPKSGATRAFAWLLEHTPADARYVMMGDADDVWLPNKIERSLGVLRSAEADVGAATPLLVHTDMTVVDEALRPIADSFWAYSGFDPEPATLRRIALRNVATGPAVLMNRALVDRVGQMPPEAIYHDGWCAMVAAGLGKIIAVPETTVLYRQHGANAVGAAQSKAKQSLGDQLRAVSRGIHNSALYRHNLVRMAKQARAYVERYGAEIAPAEREFLEAYAQIPSRPFLKRKLDVFRLHRLPEHGFLKALGDVVRA